MTKLFWSYGEMESMANKIQLLNIVDEKKRKNI